MTSFGCHLLKWTVILFGSIRLTIQLSWTCVSQYAGLLYHSVVAILPLQQSAAGGVHLVRAHVGVTKFINMYKLFTSAH